MLDETVLPGGSQVGRHLVEHRLVERVVVLAELGHLLGVDVVDEPAPLLERDTHRDVVVEALEVVPATGVVADEQELEEHGPVAEATDDVGRSLGVVGHTIGDADHEGWRVHLPDGRR